LALAVAAAMPTAAKSHFQSTPKGNANENGSKVAVISSPHIFLINLIRFTNDSDFPSSVVCD